MKKFMLFATVVAMSMALAMPAQAQSRKDKKAAQKEQWEREQRQKAEEEELRHQMKMDSLRNAATPKEDKRAKLQEEAELAELEAEIEIKKLKAANAKKAISKRVGQDLYTPCMEESYDKPGEYMAGLGIAEGEEDRGEAKLLANQYAIEDIAKRYVGMIKNGVEHYAQKAKTATGSKIRENKLEGDATVIGQKAIDKYAEQVCIEFEQNDMGTYTCYVAVHVPLKEVLNATIDELGALQTDFDRQQFRNFMQAELDKQAAAKDAEKKELQEMRKQLEQ